MKKTFLLLALVCVLVLLAACGSKPAPTEPAPTEPTSSRDLQMLYQSGITAMGADAPVLFPVSDISELSPLFPGLEEISFRQVSGGLSPVTGAPDEVVLLEVENSADVQKVVDILQKAVDEGAVESEGTDEAITRSMEGQCQHHDGWKLYLPCRFHERRIDPRRIYASLNLERKSRPSCWHNNIFACCHLV